jgi:hypothetical protein
MGLIDALAVAQHGGAQATGMTPHRGGPGDHGAFCGPSGAIKRSLVLTNVD